VGRLARDGEFLRAMDRKSARFVESRYERHLSLVGEGDRDASLLRDLAWDHEASGGDERFECSCCGIDIAVSQRETVSHARAAAGALAFFRSPERGREALQVLEA
jgi:hypothetical protein